MKDLSVIIVNYRCWDKLAQCLGSLVSISESYFSFEVIVVDNASDDGEFGEFSVRYPQISFVLNQGNRGFANGNNLGATRARGKYLLFLNPDTIVTEKALLAMLDQARVSSANSVISCSQVRENGAADKPYGRFPSPFVLNGFSRAIAKAIKMDIKPFQNDRFLFPDWVSGSVMMMSRTTFNTIGRWNERFWMYYEDVDLCKRASEAGGAIILLKNVNIVHNHGGSSRTDNEITAVTKAEVIISRHAYISLHENGLKEVLMHVFIVSGNLLFGLVPAILGILLFFQKRLFTTANIYFKLMNYYFNALLNKSWLSPRSVMYSEYFEPESGMDKSIVQFTGDRIKRA